MNDIAANMLETLRNAASDVVAKLPMVSPPFEIQIQWSRSYDELFAKSGEVTTEKVVLERLLARGRCILAGRGGAGKTQLLYRTIRYSLEQGFVPILINLKDWTSADYASWKEWTAHDIGLGAGFLLERFSLPATDALGLDVLPPNTRKLVVVDGLNEIAAQIGQEILLCLDELARDQVGMYVLVADRLTRRELPSPTRWALGATLPIAPEQIAKFVDIRSYGGSDVQSLSMPYFLNVAIKDKTVRTSRVETHAQFLLTHGGLANHELDSLAEAAFKAYADTGSRTFPLSELSKVGGQNLGQRLLDAAIVLRTQTDDVQFSHHLLHDYLAARFVAGMADEGWTALTFRTISFDGSSFDTVSMVFSLLNGERADKFLRRVYDWNPYAAAYALSEGPIAGEGPSDEVQTVILAMLAEKIFDIFEPTSRLAKDAISLVDVPIATTLKECNSLDALLTLVRNIPSNIPWFMEWKRIFTLRKGESATDDDLKQIASTDSIAGWTIANVAKRITMLDRQQVLLRALAANASNTARWRIAHVLGALPSIENVDVLEKLLTDEGDSYVQYGSLRSLFETAARTSDERVQSAAVSALLRNASGICTKPKLLAEAKRAMLVRKEHALPNWIQIVHELSRAFYEFERDEEGKDYWRKFVEETNIRYGSF
ncbi:hypothetical protein D9M73_36860 [compost metagenome]